MAIIFETTFDDTNFPTIRAPGIHWEQSDGLGDADVGQNGDHIAGAGSWTTSNGAQDQILTAANYSGGGGGKGFRHWAGDGVNNNGGSIAIDWPVPKTEIWVRWYVRYQSGFTWSAINNKQIILNNFASGNNGRIYGGFHNGVIGFVINNDPTLQESAVTWADTQGGSTGSGQFYRMEVHCKMNTSAGSSDGVFEIRYNGTDIWSDTGVLWDNAGGATWTDLYVGENADSPNNGADAFIDFDDIAVSDSGWIGGVGADTSQTRNVIFVN